MYLTTSVSLSDDSYPCYVDVNGYEIETSANVELENDSYEVTAELRHTTLEDSDLADLFDGLIDPENHSFIRYAFRHWYNQQTTEDLNTLINDLADSFSVAAPIIEPRQPTYQPPTPTDQLDSLVEATLDSVKKLSPDQLAAAPEQTVLDALNHLITHFTPLQLPHEARDELLSKLS